MRLGDAVGQRLVALALRAVGDEAEHPAVHVLEVGIAALREGAQQVERRGRLAVGHLLALRIGHARLLVELDAVDDVAAIARQRRRRPVVSLSDERGLANWPAMRPTFTTGCGAGEGQHHRHLQEHAEEVADVVGAVLGEALGAIAALQQEAVAGCDGRKLLLQLARLACKNQRRKGGELRFGLRAARPGPDRREPAGSALPSRNSATISSCQHPTLLALRRTSGGLSRPCRKRGSIPEAVRAF